MPACLAVKISKHASALTDDLQCIQTVRALKNDHPFRWKEVFIKKYLDPSVVRVHIVRYSFKPSVAGLTTAIIKRRINEIEKQSR